MRRYHHAQSNCFEMSGLNDDRTLRNDMAIRAAGYHTSLL